MTIISFFGRIFSFVFLLLLAAFSSFAVYVSSSADINLRIIVAAALFCAMVAPLFSCKTWRRTFLYSGCFFVVFLIWYLSIKPEMNADWSPDVARLPNVDVDGDTLRVQNIRDFRYRSNTDFDVNYYDKTFKLSELQTVDLFLSYWGPTEIAHTIISFGFAGGDQLAISIETRKKVGEEYSAVEGFFKKFELIYVLADERDVVGVRVNHRDEQVYLYRLRINPDQARKMLLSYIRSVDGLEERAKFYNALTTNCTTSILPHIEAFGRIPFNWALIANGHLDEWRYSQGIWGFKIPFPEFRRLSNVNEKVKLAGDAPDFSRRIREGLPSIAALQGQI